MMWEGILIVCWTGHGGFEHFRRASRTGRSHGVSEQGDVKGIWIESLIMIPNLILKAFWIL